MDTGRIQRIFELFFAPKEAGKGPGLVYLLSMVL